MYGCMYSFLPYILHVANPIQFRNKRKRCEVDTQTYRNFIVKNVKWIDDEVSKSSVKEEDVPAHCSLAFHHPQEVIEAYYHPFISYTSMWFFHFIHPITCNHCSLSIAHLSLLIIYSLLSQKNCSVNKFASAAIRLIQSSELNKTTLGFSSQQREKTGIVLTNFLGEIKQLTHSEKPLTTCLMSMLLAFSRKTHLINM